MEENCNSVALLSKKSFLLLSFIKKRSKNLDRSDLFESVIFGAIFLKLISTLYILDSVSEMYTSSYDELFERLTRRNLDTCFQNYCLIRGFYKMVERRR